MIFTCFLLPLKIQIKRRPDSLFFYIFTAKKAEYDILKKITR
ncbi:hypothetical protein BFO_1117 [Tannerella forsythia 92A2]|uniref:Uncharacterized protein n=1 Tax=Tannerella forsythia (strain ATCC 43037 / JCM 10827 / CCUG 21028 A / KCTC 5666 / FDC 338) TaxID=203275 RepID=G8UHU8_TANFA|nr:hypothetical protein BFO_1117 [Tannerella forsythia 92A2]